MTFQISWRVAWQLHQPAPSGLWTASHQVPWTSVRLGSLGGIPLQVDSALQLPNLAENFFSKTIDNLILGYRALPESTSDVNNISKTRAHEHAAKQPQLKASGKEEKEDSPLFPVVSCLRQSPP